MSDGSLRGTSGGGTAAGGTAAGNTAAGGPAAGSTSASGTAAGTPTAPLGWGGLARLLGMKPGEIGDGHCSVTLRVGPEHANPYGAVHGGVVYSLVDTAMGGAMVSRLNPTERCATLEVKINYLAPVAEGELRAEARLVERTSRIGVLEARVHADGRLIALATGTFYIQGASPNAPGV